MGVLVKAENGDKQFWELKFHATNGKVQPALKVPCYFLWSYGAGEAWGGEGEEDLFFFLCSQKVPNVFPKGVPNSTLLESLMFCPKSSPSHLYMWAKGEALYLSIGSSILGRLHSFNFFFRDGPIKFNQKKVGLVRGKAQTKNADELF